MVEIVLEGRGKNALGTPMMDFLLARLQEAAGSPVLLTGAGDAFCAGLDLKELQSLDPAGFEAYLRKLEAVVETLYTYPGPTVAWINGHAIAGGCVLALCCDHQVCADRPEIKIGLNEVALGLQFPPVTLSVIRARVPRRNLNQVVLGAQLHTPRESFRLGMIDQVSEDAGTLARARLQLLGSYPRAAYVRTKNALRGETVDSHNDARFSEMLPSWSSPEVKQKIAAALAR